MLLLLGLPFLAAPGLSSEVSENFQAKLEKACLKIDSPKNCSCWSRSVTQRYDDGQLMKIFQLMKNAQANQMFMVTHSVEGRICQSAN